MSDQANDAHPHDEKSNPPNHSHDFEAEIQKLEERAEENLNGWKRATADYQNLVKETEKERQRAAQFANEQLIQQLLPLVDYFDFAFSHAPEDQRDGSWMSGVHHIHDQLINILKEHGVTAMETVGKLFDPTLHEAVGEVESTDVKPHHIIEQTQRGFLMHGTCVRPAKVKIAK